MIYWYIKNYYIRYPLDLTKGIHYFNNVRLCTMRIIKRHIILCMSQLITYNINRFQSSSNTPHPLPTFKCSSPLEVKVTVPSRSQQSILRSCLCPENCHPENDLDLLTLVTWWCDLRNRWWWPHGLHPGPSALCPVLLSAPPRTPCLP